jgi:8-amino-7-oxononanoate synthase
MNANFNLPDPTTPVKMLKDFTGPVFHNEQVDNPRAADGWVNIAKQGRCLMMSSYSYLGLIGHPEIDAATKSAIDTYGTGVHGSRLVTGTLAIHKQLEDVISRYYGHADTILFSSGYVANVATISALVGEGDTVFCDVLSHASIKDGCRMSGAEVVTFAHNNMRDLGRKLQRCQTQGNRLIVADAIYSMEGDVADLPGLADLSSKYGALLLLDEAHSLGVIGKSGKGIEEHFGMPAGTIDVKMGTLSKTVPSIGGYVTASKEIIELLRNRARGYIFSSALTGPAAGAAIASFSVIQKEPWRVAKLQANAEFFRQALNEGGVPTLNSTTAVIPAVCGDSAAALQVSSDCLQSNIIAMPITYPAVQNHIARLRLIPCANHSVDDLAYASRIICATFRRLKLSRG